MQEIPLTLVKVLTDMARVQSSPRRILAAGKNNNFPRLAETKARICGPFKAHEFMAKPMDGTDQQAGQPTPSEMRSLLRIYEIRGVAEMIDLHHDGLLPLDGEERAALRSLGLKIAELEGTLQ